ncbi:MAG: T9SS type A sorting domain-containing protein [Bacteroidia bacterium]|nr:T9SS type A sorting domain-containing protein [Bacteroidia bacterium]
MKNLFLSFLVVVLVSKLVSAQAPFQVHIKPINITGLGGLQSFAFAQNNGKWLIMGGRLDGLHQRQPFAAFDIAGHNTQLIVVDPVTKQKWAASISTLPVAIQEQLKATNAQFFQEGNYLYVIGGYGYSATISDHTTFANLTAIDVPSAVNAVINSTSLTPHFRQITDTKFQVTGGRLEKIYGAFYLVGGQKFLGRYNPMGPTHGPGFTQEYTDQIRKFTLTDDGTTLSINHFPAITDSNELHRRDYNVTAQIMPNGEEGLTAFSGVFQKSANLPFLNCVNIDSNGYSVKTSFSQYYNHYHCANFPIYSEYYREMNTVFFGGIAQYYDNAGTLVQDNNVPFVKTIARVSRDVAGNMAEHKLPIEMPSLLGSGSEFIPNLNIPRYHNGVIKMDSLIKDTTLLGYIYGGISSTAANIFFTNTGTQSSASSQIFEVYLIKGVTYGIHELNKSSISSLKLKVFPNPNQGDFKVNFQLTKISDVTITLTDLNGKLIEKTVLKKLHLGDNTFKKQIEEFNTGGIYFLTIETDYEKASRKLILKK